MESKELSKTRKIWMDSQNREFPPCRKTLGAPYFTIFGFLASNLLEKKSNAGILFI
jgi:hypothetical protein